MLKNNDLINQSMRAIVFDIETIPDCKAGSRLLNMTEENDVEVRKELVKRHLMNTNGNNAFLRQLFHKVIAISVVEFSINIDSMDEECETFEDISIYSLGSTESSETDLLIEFFKKIDLYKPRLISFNGRTFDLPVLKYRALAAGIRCPAIYDEKNKWNSYSQRYCFDRHCDLLEMLSDFGASARIKLEEICALIGLPGKFGIDGSNVLEMFENGRIEEIRNYCETDALNTFLLYLRVMTHRGKITEKSHDNIVRKTISEMANSKHLVEFGKIWRKVSNGSFMFNPDNIMS